MSSTLPVSRHGFAYAHDSFFAETSNKNHHRRATVPELHEILHPTTASTAHKDPTGHWYEAQLLHYGLAPSKSKAVAKGRLLDAVNRGTLAVPAHVLKVEADLRKEWLKKDRAAKKEEREGKEKGGAKKVATAKRKRENQADAGDYRVHVSVNIGIDGPSGVGSGEHAKRQKQVAKKGAASPGLRKTGAQSTKASPTPNKQTAKSSGQSRGASVRGRGNTGRQRGGAATSSRQSQSANASTAASAPSPSRPKQTARRSRPSSGGVGRSASAKAVKQEETSIDGHYIKKEVKSEELDTGDWPNDVRSLALSFTTCGPSTLLQHVTVLTRLCST